MDAILLLRVKGSHETWYSPITKVKFTVSKTIKAKGTFYGVLKQAGIKINP